MIITKPFKLKFTAFSIIIFSILSCNATGTKITPSKPVQQVKKAEVVQNKQNRKSVPTASASTGIIPAWRRPASHTLTRGSKDAIFPAAKEGNLKLLKELLAEGTEVDHRNFNGETVLHVAASRGDLAMVKYLVGAGADVNAQTGKKWQPIHHAMRFDHPAVANYLIKHNASPLTKTSDGLSALELAKESKKTAMQNIIKKYK